MKTSFPNTREVQHRDQYKQTNQINTRSPMKDDQGSNSSTQMQLDKYLNGSLKSNLDMQESKRFEQQALKSGFNQLDTQKLLELVQKYSGGVGSQTGEGGTLRT